MVGIRLSAIPLGARYMVLSAMGFAILAAAVKWVSQKGIPVLEIVAARSIISLFLSFVVIRSRGISVWGNRKGLLFARGGVGSLALVCVYYAISTLPLAEATVLQYLTPMFTAILALIVLHERLEMATLICVILSFVGLLCIARPAVIFGGQVDPLPALSVVVAVMGALGSGVAYVIVRKLSATEDPSVIIFYFPLVAMPFSIGLLGDAFIIPDVAELLGLLVVGIGTQVGQTGLTLALRTEAAGRATAFSYLQVVFAVALGWFVFGEMPVVWTWVGAALIVSGALVNVLGIPATVERRGMVARDRN